MINQIVRKPLWIINIAILIILTSLRLTESGVTKTGILPGGEVLRCVGNWQCKYGAECNDHRQCECRFKCRRSRRVSICGNNGRTYKNYCSLNKASCLKQKPIGIDCVGKCDECKELSLNVRTKSPQIGNVGGAVTLPCEFSAPSFYPNNRPMFFPRIHWYKKVGKYREDVVKFYFYPKAYGKYIGRVRISFQAGNASLTLWQLRPSDKGTYFCEVRVALKDETKSVELLVSEETPKDIADGTNKMYTPVSQFSSTPGHNIRATSSKADTIQTTKLADIATMTPDLSTVPDTFNSYSKISSTSAIYPSYVYAWTTPHPSVSNDKTIFPYTVHPLLDNEEDSDPTYSMALKASLFTKKLDTRDTSDPSVFATSRTIASVVLQPTLRTSGLSTTSSKTPTFEVPDTESIIKSQSPSTPTSINNLLLTTTDYITSEETTTLATTADSEKLSNGKKSSFAQQVSIALMNTPEPMISDTTTEIPNLASPNRVPFVSKLFTTNIPIKQPQTFTSAFSKYFPSKVYNTSRRSDTIDLSVLQDLLNRSSKDDRKITSTFSTEIVTASTTVWTDSHLLLTRTKAILNEAVKIDCADSPDLATIPTNVITSIVGRNMSDHELQPQLKTISSKSIVSTETSILKDSSYNTAIDVTIAPLQTVSKSIFSSESNTFRIPKKEFSESKFPVVNNTEFPGPSKAKASDNLTNQFFTYSTLTPLITEPFGVSNESIQSPVSATSSDNLLISIIPDKYQMNTKMYISKLPDMTSASQSTEQALSSKVQFVDTSPNITKFFHTSDTISRNNFPGEKSATIFQTTLRSNSIQTITAVEHSLTEVNTKRADPKVVVTTKLPDLYKEMESKYARTQPSENARQPQHVDVTDVSKATSIRDVKKTVNREDEKNTKHVTGLNQLETFTTDISVFDGLASYQRYPASEATANVSSSGLHIPFVAETTDVTIYTRNNLPQDISTKEKTGNGLSSYDHTIPVSMPNHFTIDDFVSHKISSETNILDDLLFSHQTTEFSESPVDKLSSEESDFYYSMATDARIASYASPYEFSTEVKTTHSDLFSQQTTEQLSKNISDKASSGEHTPSVPNSTDVVRTSDFYTLLGTSTGTTSPDNAKDFAQITESTKSISDNDPFEDPTVSIVTSLDFVILKEEFSSYGLSTEAKTLDNEITLSNQSTELSGILGSGETLAVQTDSSAKPTDDFTVAEDFYPSYDTSSEPNITGKVSYQSPKVTESVSHELLSGDHTASIGKITDVATATGVLTPYENLVVFTPENVIESYQNTEFPGSISNKEKFASVGATTRKIPNNISVTHHTFTKSVTNEMPYGGVTNPVSEFSDSRQIDEISGSVMDNISAGEHLISVVPSISFVTVVDDFESEAVSTTAETFDNILLFNQSNGARTPFTVIKSTDISTEASLRDSTISHQTTDFPKSIAEEIFSGKYTTPVTKSSEVAIDIDHYTSYNVLTETKSLHNVSVSYRTTNFPESSEDILSGGGVATIAISANRSREVEASGSIPVSQEPKNFTGSHTDEAFFGESNYTAFRPTQIMSAPKFHQTTKLPQTAEYELSGDQVATVTKIKNVITGADEFTLHELLTTKDFLANALASHQTTEFRESITDKLSPEENTASGDRYSIEELFTKAYTLGESSTLQRTTEFSKTISNEISSGEHIDFDFISTDDITDIDDFTMYENYTEEKTISLTPQRINFSESVTDEVFSGEHTFYVDTPTSANGVAEHITEANVIDKMYDTQQTIQLTESTVEESSSEEQTAAVDATKVADEYEFLTEAGYTESKTIIEGRSSGEPTASVAKTTDVSTVFTESTSYASKIALYSQQTSNFLESLTDESLSGQHPPVAVSPTTVINVAEGSTMYDEFVKTKPVKNVSDTYRATEFSESSGNEKLSVDNIESVETPLITAVVENFTLYKASTESEFKISQNKMSCEEQVTSPNSLKLDMDTTHTNIEMLPGSGAEYSGSYTTKILIQKSVWPNDRTNKFSKIVPEAYTQDGASYMMTSPIYSTRDHPTDTPSRIPGIFTSMVQSGDIQMTPTVTSGTLELPTTEITDKYEISTEEQTSFLEYHSQYQTTELSASGSGSHHTPPNTASTAKTFYTTVVRNVTDELFSGELTLYVNTPTGAYSVAEHITGANAIDKMYDTQQTIQLTDSTVDESSSGKKTASVTEIVNATRVSGEYEFLTDAGTSESKTIIDGRSSGEQTALVDETTDVSTAFSKFTPYASKIALYSQQTSNVLESLTDESLSGQHPSVAVSPANVINIAEGSIMYDHYDGFVKTKPVKNVSDTYQATDFSESSSDEKSSVDDIDSVETPLSTAVSDVENFALYEASTESKFEMSKTENSSEEQVTSSRLLTLDMETTRTNIGMLPGSGGEYSGSHTTKIRIQRTALPNNITNKFSKIVSEAHIQDQAPYMMTSPTYSTHGQPTDTASRRPGIFTPMAQNGDIQMKPTVESGTLVLPTTEITDEYEISTEEQTSFLEYHSQYQTMESSASGSGSHYTLTNTVSKVKTFNTTVVSPAKDSLSTLREMSTPPVTGIQNFSQYKNVSTEFEDDSIVITKPSSVSDVPTMLNQDSLFISSGENISELHPPITTPQPSNSFKTEMGAPSIEDDNLSDTQTLVSNAFPMHTLISSEHAATKIIRESTLVPLQYLDFSGDFDSSNISADQILNTNVNAHTDKNIVVIGNAENTTYSDSESLSTTSETSTETRTTTQNVSITTTTTISITPSGDNAVNTINAMDEYTTSLSGDIFPSEPSSKPEAEKQLLTFETTKPAHYSSVANTTSIGFENLDAFPVVQVVKNASSATNRSTQGAPVSNLLTTKSLYDIGISGSGYQTQDGSPTTYTVDIESKQTSRVPFDLPTSMIDSYLDMDGTLKDDITTFYTSILSETYITNILDTEQHFSSAEVSETSALLPPENKTSPQFSSDPAPMDPAFNLDNESSSWSFYGTTEDVPDVNNHTTYETISQIVFTAAQLNGISNYQEQTTFGSTLLNRSYPEDGGSMSNNDFMSEEASASELIATQVAPVIVEKPTIQKHGQLSSTTTHYTNITTTNIKKEVTTEYGSGMESSAHEQQMMTTMAPLPESSFVTELHTSTEAKLTTQHRQISSTTIYFANTSTPHFTREKISPDYASGSGLESSIHQQQKMTTLASLGVSSTDNETLFSVYGSQTEKLEKTSFSVTSDVSLPTMHDSSDDYAGSVDIEHTEFHASTAVKPFTVKHEDLSSTTIYSTDIPTTHITSEKVSAEYGSSSGLESSANEKQMMPTEDSFDDDAVSIDMETTELHTSAAGKPTTVEYERSSSTASYSTDISTSEVIFEGASAEYEASSELESSTHEQQFLTTMSPFIVTSTDDENTAITNITIGKVTTEYGSSSGMESSAHEQQVMTKKAPSIVSFTDNETLFATYGPQTQKIEEITFLSTFEVSLPTLYDSLDGTAVFIEMEQTELHTSAEKLTTEEQGQISTTTNYFADTSTSHIPLEKISAENESGSGLESSTHEKHGLTTMDSSVASSTYNETLFTMYAPQTEEQRKTTFLSTSDFSFSTMHDSFDDYTVSIDEEHTQFPTSAAQTPTVEKREQISSTVTYFIDTSTTNITIEEVTTNYGSSSGMESSAHEQQVMTTKTPSIVSSTDNETSLTTFVSKADKLEKTSFLATSDVSLPTMYDSFDDDAVSMEMEPAELHTSAAGKPTTVKHEKLSSTKTHFTNTPTTHITFEKVSAEYGSSSGLEPSTHEQQFMTTLAPLVASSTYNETFFTKYVPQTGERGETIFLSTSDVSLPTMHDSYDDDEASIDVVYTELYTGDTGKPTTMKHKKLSSTTTYFTDTSTPHIIPEKISAENESSSGLDSSTHEQQRMTTMLSSVASSTYNETLLTLYVPQTKEPGKTTVLSSPDFSLSTMHDSFDDDTVSTDEEHTEFHTSAAQQPTIEKHEHLSSTVTYFTDTSKTNITIEEVTTEYESSSGMESSAHEQQLRTTRAPSIVSSTDNETLLTTSKAEKLEKTSFFAAFDVSLPTMYDSFDDDALSMDIEPTELHTSAAGKPTIVKNEKLSSTTTYTIDTSTSEVTLERVSAQYASSSELESSTHGQKFMTTMASLFVSPNDNETTSTTTTEYGSSSGMESSAHEQQVMTTKAPSSLSFTDNETLFATYVPQTQKIEEITFLSTFDVSLPTLYDSFDDTAISIEMEPTEFHTGAAEKLTTEKQGQISTTTTYSGDTTTPFIVHEKISAEYESGSGSESSTHKKRMMTTMASVVVSSTDNASLFTMYVPQTEERERTTFSAFSDVNLPTMLDRFDDDTVSIDVEHTEFHTSGARKPTMEAHEQLSSTVTYFTDTSTTNITVEEVTTEYRSSSGMESSAYDQQVMTTKAPSILSSIDNKTLLPTMKAEKLEKTSFFATSDVSLPTMYDSFDDDTVSMVKEPSEIYTGSAEKTTTVKREKLSSTTTYYTTDSSTSEVTLERISAEYASSSELESSTHEQQFMTTMTPLIVSSSKNDTLLSTYVPHTQKIEETTFLSIIDVSLPTMHISFDDDEASTDVVYTEVHTRASGKSTTMKHKKLSSTTAYFTDTSTPHITLEKLSDEQGSSSGLESSTHDQQMMTTKAPSIVFSTDNETLLTTFVSKAEKLEKTSFLTTTDVSLPTIYDSFDDTAVSIELVHIEFPTSATTTTIFSVDTSTPHFPAEKISAEYQSGSELELTTHEQQMMTTLNSLVESSTDNETLFTMYVPQTEERRKTAFLATPNVSLPTMTAIIRHKSSTADSALGSTTEEEEKINQDETSTQILDTSTVPEFKDSSWSTDESLETQTQPIILVPASDTTVSSQVLNTNSIKYESFSPTLKTKAGMTTTPVLKEKIASYATHGGIRSTHKTITANKPTERENGSTVNPYHESTLVTFIGVETGSSDYLASRNTGTAKVPTRTADKSIVSIHTNTFPQTEIQTKSEFEESTDQGSEAALPVSQKFYPTKLSLTTIDKLLLSTNTLDIPVSKEVKSDSFPSSLMPTYAVTTGLGLPTQKAPFPQTSKRYLSSTVSEPTTTPTLQLFGTDAELVTSSYLDKSTFKIDAKVPTDKPAKTTDVTAKYTYTSKLGTPDNSTNILYDPSDSFITETFPPYKQREPKIYSTAHGITNESDFLRITSTQPPATTDPLSFTKFLLKPNETTKYFPNNISNTQGSSPGIGLYNTTLATDDVLQSKQSGKPTTYRSQPSSYPVTDLMTRKAFVTSKRSPGLEITKTSIGTDALYPFSQTEKSLTTTSKIDVHPVAESKETTLPSTSGQASSCGMKMSKSRTTPKALLQSRTRKMSSETTMTGYKEKSKPSSKQESKHATAVSESTSRPVVRPVSTEGIPSATTKVVSEAETTTAAVKATSPLKIDLKYTDQIFDKQPKIKLITATSTMFAAHTSPNWLTKGIAADSGDKTQSQRTPGIITGSAIPSSTLFTGQQNTTIKSVAMYNKQYTTADIATTSKRRTKKYQDTARSSATVVSSTEAPIFFDDQATTQPCPTFWQKFRSNCYRFIPLLMTWRDAKRHCESQSSSLSSIHDQDESGYILDLGYVDQWIGLHIDDNEREFKWNDQSSVDFVNWLPGQPRKHHNSEENCVVAIYETFGKWNDVLCEYKMSFTCKRSPDDRLTTILKTTVGLSKNQYTSRLIETTQQPIQEADRGYTTPCPSGWTEFNFNCYQYQNTKLNWRMAEMHCQQIGGHLASIHNLETNKFINRLGGFMEQWIGLNDIKVDGVLRWTDDRKLVN
ncbi:uncharacterized protein LOC144430476 [Styela clava]